MRKKTRKADPYCNWTRKDFEEMPKILHAAAVLMDGRSFHAKQYKKLAGMLAYADEHLPK